MGTNGFKPGTTARLSFHNRALKMGLNDEPLELCDEHAELVIDEIRKELGTIFGYDPQSQKVGITGEIELAEIDGPTVKVDWHLSLYSFEIHVKMDFYLCNFDCLRSIAL